MPPSERVKVLVFSRQAPTAPSRKPATGALRGTRPAQFDHSSHLFEILQSVGPGRRRMIDFHQAGGSAFAAASVSYFSSSQPASFRATYHRELNRLEKSATDYLVFSGPKAAIDELFKSEKYFQKTAGHPLSAYSPVERLECRPVDVPALFLLRDALSRLPPQVRDYHIQKP